MAWYKDAVHVFQDIMMMLMWVSTLILFPLGMDVVNHYDYPECTVFSFDGGDANKNNVRGKTDAALVYFILGVFLIGLYTFGANTFRSPRSMMMFIALAIIGLVGAVFISLAIGVLLLAILTSQCTVIVGQDADVKNGQNHALPLFSGFYIAMLLCASIRRFGKWYQFERQDVKNHHWFADVIGGWFHIFWRMILSWYAFYMFENSNSSFEEKYVIPTTGACVDALAKSSLDTDQQRMFENFEVGEFKDGSWVINHHYYRICIAAGSLTIVHSVIHLYWTIVSGFSLAGCVKGKGESAAAQGSMLLGRVLGLTVDILLIIVSYVVVAHHEIASCPVLDPQHPDVRDFYRLIALFTIQIYVGYVIMSEYSRSTNEPFFVNNATYKRVSRGVTSYSNQQYT